MLTCLEEEHSVASRETPKATVFRISGSNFSLRLIAAAIILLFFYYAAGVALPLLFSVVRAYFRDPAVEFLERFRVPRTIGALIPVLLMILVLIAVGYTLWLRTSDFAADWPKYREILRSATKTVQGNINSFEGGVNDLTSSGGAAKSVVSHEDSGAVRNLVVRGIGSLYALVLEATFVPFLVFFMLAHKRAVWHGPLHLFPVSRP